jgi:hypothetical protein
MLLGDSEKKVRELKESLLPVLHKGIDTLNDLEGYVDEERVDASMRVDDSIEARERDAHTLTVVIRYEEAKETAEELFRQISELPEYYRPT